MKQDLVDGQHRNVPGKDYFTTAYFHRPEELTNEIEEAGLVMHAAHGVEGPFWFMSGFAALFEDPASRALMLAMLRLLESEPSMLGASAHWLAVARRPE